MLVSIIIATSRTLKVNRALSSIKNLDFETDNFEVIIVKDPDVTVNVHLPNLKVFNADKNHPSLKRNIGVKKSTGKYLAFVDDDVWIPSEWLKKGIDLLEKQDYYGISGSDYSMQKGLKYRLSNSVFLSKVGLGTDAHFSKKYQKAKFYENLLCNCIIKREIWLKVGGFNEIADYHVDDTEFFFIVYKLDIQLIKYPELRLNHEREPLLFPYLRMIFQKTFCTGVNTMVFPEIYFQIPTIILMFLGLLLTPFIIYYWKIIPILLFFYLFIIWCIHIKEILKSPLFFCLIAPALFLHHFAGIMGFGAGILYYLLNPGKWKKTKEYKAVRYSVLM